jgi:hypothetical protein
MKTDRIIREIDYGKLSIITIATSLFTYKKNQEDNQD